MKLRKAVMNVSKVNLFLTSTQSVVLSDSRVLLTAIRNYYQPKGLADPVSHTCPAKDDSGMAYLDSQTQKEISLDLDNYSSLDSAMQDVIIQKYRALNNRINIIIADFIGSLSPRNIHVTFSSPSVDSTCISDLKNTSVVGWGLGRVQRGDIGTWRL
ncbi:hypothetical protein AJ80_05225 [Polytolypa hystricis UAMH7299]|uniref:Uncharacterized protein n=1 Tax=Polytolypa hystricis (strain UAMH7299) TaxID=1447883 RepID=A0A2B7Y5A7_POLH7|nr:hypothetical protein AJ80_05225 [Polytolypa hystricis UAMH7299]